MTQPVKLPAPPYYAVIFTSIQTGQEEEAYNQTAARLREMAEDQPGYLGIESSHDPGGQEITISYWRDVESIEAWQKVEQHREAQTKGRSTWYEQYSIRVCRVENTKDFQKESKG